MQLKDFSEQNIKAALNLKADFMDDNFSSIIFQNDVDLNKRGFRALLLTEPHFFLINDSFIDVALNVTKVIGDNYSYRKLKELDMLDKEKRISLAKDYVYLEQMRRGYRFSYEEYQDMLELEDLLLREVPYNYLIDNPYILFSISYLKTQFDNYYNDEMKNSYLYTILDRLSKDNTLDNDSLVAINSVKEIFSDETKDSKIITFSKRNK